MLATPPRFEHSSADSDRKSTRLNSSHQIISYAVFCLKKKKKINVTAVGHINFNAVCLVNTRTASTASDVHYPHTVTSHRDSTRRTQCSINYTHPHAQH